MEGIITIGTTLGGRGVNAGERVECTEDEYRKLFVAGDIVPVPSEVNVVVAEPEPEAKKPAAKKPAKKKGK